MNPIMEQENNKKKLIISCLLWVKENWQITNKTEYENKYKKIVERNKPINEEEKYGYKRTLKSIVNIHTGEFSGTRTLYFHRFSYCWDSLLKQVFTLPHRATYKTKNIKKRTNVLFNIWFKNMVEERNEKGEELEEECPICYENLFTGTIKTTICNHNLCKNCFKNIIEKTPNYRKPKCPMCRTELN
jgi:hypothetical protein